RAENDARSPPAALRARSTSAVSSSSVIAIIAHGTPGRRHSLGTASKKLPRRNPPASGLPPINHETSCEGRCRCVVAVRVTCGDGIETMAARRTDLKKPENQSPARAFCVQHGEAPCPDHL